MQRRQFVAALAATVASPSIALAKKKKPKVARILLEVRRRQGFVYSASFALDGTLVAELRGSGADDGVTVVVEQFDTSELLWRQSDESQDQRFELTGTGTFRFGLDLPVFTRLGIVEVEA